MTTESGSEPRGEAEERMNMANSKIWVETTRRVWGKDGGFVEIGPWPDAPDSFLELRTVEGESRDYFGPLSLSMSLDLARRIGMSLIAAADEMQKK